MRLFKATNNHILKGWVPIEMSMKEFLIMRVQSVKEKKAVLSRKRDVRKSTES